MQIASLRARVQTLLNSITRVLREAYARAAQQSRGIIRMNLKMKATFWVLVLVCISILFSVNLVLTPSEKSLRESLDRRAYSLLSNSGELNREPLILCDKFRLNAAAKRLTQNEPDVLYASITDKCGNEYNTTVLTEIEAQLPDFLKTLDPPGERTKPQSGNFRGIRIIDHSNTVVVKDTLIGSFRIGISEESITEPIRSMRLKAFIAGCIVLLICSGLTYWGVHRGLDPLVDLTVFAQRLGSGEFGSTIEMRRKDELGELGETLNWMSGHIAASQQMLADRERVARELELARSLQQRFLPKLEDLPKIPGITLDLVCKPAREVGGDFYCVMQIDKDRYGFVMADVSGKGDEAAQVVLVTIALLQEAVLVKPRMPKELLSLVNSALLMLVKGDLHVTLNLTIVNTKTGAVEILSAGHPDALLVTKDAVVPVEAGGAILGLMETDDFKDSLEVKKFELEQGQRLLLYTDGVNEARNRNQDEFGTERIVTALGSEEVRVSEAPTKLLLDHVEAFSRSEPQSDDITMLSITKD